MNGEATRDLLDNVRDGDQEHDMAYNFCLMALENGADICARDDHGYTALDWAIANGQERTFKLVIETIMDTKHAATANALGVFRQAQRLLSEDDHDPDLRSLLKNQIDRLLDRQFATDPRRTYPYP